MQEGLLHGSDDFEIMGITTAETEFDRQLLIGSAELTRQHIIDELGEQQPTIPTFEAYQKRMSRAIGNRSMTLADRKSLGHLQRARKRYSQRQYLN